MSAYFRSKDGTTHTLASRVGSDITDLLRANGVPHNATITRKNGVIVPEYDGFDSSDQIEVSHIRPYDLGVTRSPNVRTYPVDNPIYTKAITFDRQGELEVIAEQFNENTYPKWVEDTFVESITTRNLIVDNDKLVVGLSGGRDSVAFLALLERTRDRLPPFEIIPVTVTGLPDWEEPATFSSAVNSAAALGAKHVVVKADEVQKLFKLSKPLVDVLDEVIATTSGSEIMMITHHVMRRSIEMFAERGDYNRIILGLNADDLLATLVSWFLHGYPMGGIPERMIGNMMYLFPLYRITKKELTLYLECVRPDLNKQGAPGRFTRGPGERSMSYALADHLLTLMPGVDYYALDAFERIGKFMQLPPHIKCDICGASFLDLKEGEKPNDKQTQCDVCEIFSTHRK